MSVKLRSNLAPVLTVLNVSQTRYNLAPVLTILNVSQKLLSTTIPNFPVVQTSLFNLE